MSKQIIVLLGLNSRHEIVESDIGVAFATDKLLNEQWVAIYVAKNRSDANAAIQHYSDDGTLVGFIQIEGHEAKGAIETHYAREAQRATLRALKDLYDKYGHMGKSELAVATMMKIERLEEELESEKQ